jgi:hypothetical protein
MSVDRGYVNRNNAERARLAALVKKWTDADLAHAMPAGWTVAGVLGHVAFWDQRILTLLDAWEKSGPAAVPPAIDEHDVDWVNDAAKPMLLAVAPRKAAELTLAIAEEVDRKVAAPERLTGLAAVHDLRCGSTRSVNASSCASCVSPTNRTQRSVAPAAA